MHSHRCLLLYLVVLLAHFAVCATTTLGSCAATDDDNRALRFDDDEDIRTLVAQFVSDGYVILPGLFEPSEIRRLARLVDEQVSLGTFGGPRPDSENGYFISDALQHPHLRKVAEALHSNKNLHRFLIELFGGGDKYRALPRNDIMVDEAAAPRWHQDKLVGGVADHVNAPEFVSLGDERYGLINAAIYLEDHSNDDHALWVAPGSNRAGYANPKHNASVPTVILRPKIGDGIIFDWRTYHRGGYVHEKYNRKRKGTNERQHRSMLASTFGRTNIFSEVMARALEIKHQTNTFDSDGMSLSGCMWEKQQKKWKQCASDFTKRELERRPLTPEQQALVDAAFDGENENMPEYEGSGWES